MKPFLILAIFFVFQAQAQMRCEALFQNGRIENFKKLPSDIYSYKDDMDLRRLQDRYHGFLPEEKIKAISKFFERNQVEYKKQSRWRLLPYPQYYEFMEIQTTGSSELNRQAKKIYDLYGTRMVYAPFMLSKYSMSGGHDGIEKVIYISHGMAMTDLPDLTYLHEVRHMAMTSKENTGKGSIVNGKITKVKYLRDKWPWGKASTSGYENYFSVQEAETWHQGFVYNLAHIRQLARDGKLNFDDLHKWIDQVRNKNPESMLEDILDLVEYELERIQVEVPKMAYDPEKQEIQFGKVGWLYYYSHNVPKKFIEDYFEQNSSKFQLNAESIKTLEGQAISRKIIQTYLVELQKNLQSKADFYAEGKSLLREIERRSNYLASQEKPIEELNDLIAKLGKDPDWTPLDINHIQFSDLSRLPESGFDFSKLDRRHYKEFSQKFNSKDELRDYEKFFMEVSFQMDMNPGYVKAEVFFLRNGVQESLILEGSPAVDILRIALDRLAEQGLTITRINAKAIDYAEIEKHSIPNLDSSFFKMSKEELIARNQFRVDQALQKN